MSKIKGLGLFPSPIDKRDILMSAVLPVLSVPAKFVVKELSDVGDQGEEGTCVGFACTVGMKESQELKENKRIIKLSPRYLYQKCKEIDGIPEADGTSINIAMKILYNLGVCEEEYWSYAPNQVGVPRQGANENAKNYKIKSYENIGKSLQTMKTSLIVNGPFVIGVSVFDNWQTTEVWDTGKIPLPKGGDIGGHALCVVGYDDDTQMLKFKNSWGNEWGDEGYGYLPYDYIKYDKYFEAYGATDLIDNVRSLIDAKEKILEQFGEDFKEKVNISNVNKQIIEYQ
jgi:C1A family cysteine protease